MIGQTKKYGQFLGLHILCKAAGADTCLKTFQKFQTLLVWIREAALYSCLQIQLDSHAFWSDIRLNANGRTFVKDYIHFNILCFRLKAFYTWRQDFLETVFSRNVSVTFWSTFRKMFNIRPRVKLKIIGLNNFHYVETSSRYMWPDGRKQMYFSKNIDI